MHFVGLYRITLLMLHVTYLQTRVPTKAVGLCAVHELTFTGSQRAFISVHHLWFGFSHVDTEKINSGTRVALHLHNVLSALLAVPHIWLLSMLIHSRRKSIVAKYTVVSGRLLSRVQLNIYDIDFKHKL